MCVWEKGGKVFGCVWVVGQGIGGLARMTERVHPTFTIVSSHMGYRESMYQHMLEGSAHLAQEAKQRDGGCDRARIRDRRSSSSQAICVDV